VTGVQTCALPIYASSDKSPATGNIVASLAFATRDNYKLH
jgi:hypothetical protein